MLRDWTVSEQPNIKSVVEVTSCSENHVTTIVVKWRPFGRSNSRRVMGWIPSVTLLNSRDPVSLGEVEGVVHCPSLCPREMEDNARSSRRGKEQMRPKISESGRVAKSKRRDLRTGDNPCNGTRVIPPWYNWPTVTSKRTTPQNEEIVSTCVALMGRGQ